MKEKLTDNNADKYFPFSLFKEDLNQFPISCPNKPPYGIGQKPGANLFDLHCTNEKCPIRKVLKILEDKCNRGICVTTRDYRYAFFNEKYKNTLGFGSDELNRMALTDTVAEQDKILFSKVLRTVLDGVYPAKNFNPTVVRKNGKRILVETSNVKIDWMGKPAVVSILNDINCSKEENVTLDEQLEQIDAKRISSSESIRQKQKELEDYKTKLELTSKELMKTNHAMSILARNIDNEKNKSEQNISKVVMNKILPIISDLKAKPGMKKYRAELQVLNEYVNSLSHESELGDMVFSNLTETEMRIASLIKNGMSSANIADALHISIETVKTHRKKIRKKLKIQNTDTNLTTYLKMSLGE